MRKVTKEHKKEVARKWNKMYREKYPDRIKLSKKKYNSSQKGKEKNKEYNKIWNKNNPEKELKRKQDFITRMELLKKSNPKEYKQKHQKWVKEHPEKRREYANRSNYKMYHNNVNHRIRKILRSRLKTAIKRNQVGEKCDHTLNLLGCTVPYFLKYIESLWKDGMSWDNYGRYGWHIDHIKPCASFNLKDPEQQKTCFHYTNMQPLWAEENRSKSDKTI